MHDLHATMQWYRVNNTTEEIGFNPDGKCLQVCRTARDIPAVYPSAKKSQDATPAKHRFPKVKDWRKGMVLYIDDPNDTNRYGHIVTIVGRVKGFDENEAHDVLVKTNSVKSGEIVVVRADYFTEHWGDKIQFASDWLNGEVVDVFQRKPKKTPAGAQPHTREDFAKSRPNWDVKILDRVAERHPDVKETVKKIDHVVDMLPDDTKDERVTEFKEKYEKDRVLNLNLLTDVVKDDARFTKVKWVRDELRGLIKSVLPR